MTCHQKEKVQNLFPPQFFHKINTFIHLYHHVIQGPWCKYSGFEAKPYFITFPYRFVLHFILWLGLSLCFYQGLQFPRMQVPLHCFCLAAVVSMKNW